MLKPSEVENLARTAVQTALRRARSEDSVLELKSALPASIKAARQIAALCNAAPGDDAIWVVGVSEEGQFTPLAEELADWSSAVNKHFDGAFPHAKSYNIVFEEHPLTLLHFMTDLRPFVVTRSDGNTEVPWRHLNKTRNARRGELLQLFVPTISKPIIKIVRAHVTQERITGQLNIGMDLYIIPTNDVKIVVPLYKCSVRIEYDTHCVWFPPLSIKWTQLPGPSLAGSLQFIFREPTFFKFIGRHGIDYYQPQIGEVPPKSIRLVFRMGYATNDEHVDLIANLPETNLTEEVQHFEVCEPGWISR